MNNLDWLNGLTKTFSGNLKAYLDVLDINYNNFYKIKLSGNSFRVTTISVLIEAISKLKISAVSIGFNFIGSINEQIKKNTNMIDDESLDFHISCIKTIYEETNLDISYNEALFLIAINYAREQKVNYFIAEEAYDFINEIEYDYNISTVNNESVISPLNIDMKDYLEYKSELCSFSYNFIDYDMPYFGSFNGLFVALAICALENFILPDKKVKKYKKAISEVSNKGISERVNLNPRIILNVIDSIDLEGYKEMLFKVLNRKMIVLSNDETYNPDFLVKDLADLENCILAADTFSLILIAGSRDFITKVRPIFFTKK